MELAKTRKLDHGQKKNDSPEVLGQLYNFRLKLLGNGTGCCDR